MQQDASANLLASLLRMQKGDILTDVTVVCNGKKFRAHKNALYVGCGYFRRRFDEGIFSLTVDEIHLSGVTADDFEFILDFIYAGEVTFDYNNRDQLKTMIAATEYLEMIDLNEYCWWELTNLVTYASFIKELEICDEYNRPKWSSDIKEKLTKEFSLVSASHQFYRLLLSDLVDILTHPDLECSADETLSAILRWVEDKVDERRGSLFQLVSCLELDKITSTKLKISISDENLITQDPAVLSHLKAEADRRLAVKTAQRIFPVGSCLYCVGFPLGSSSACLMTYDCSKIEWSRVAMLQVDILEAVAVAECEGNLYILGAGKNCADVPSKHVCKVDLRGQRSASAVCDALTAVKEARMGSLAGLVYLIGGKNEAGDELSDVQCYDPSTDEWVKKANTVWTHVSPRVVAAMKMICVVGSTNRAEVEMYNPATDKWIVVTSIPKFSEYHREFFMAVGCRHNIYVLKSPTEAAFECFDLRSLQWMRVKFSSNCEALTNIKCMWSPFAADLKRSLIAAVNGANDLYLYFPTDSSWMYLTTVDSRIEIRSLTAYCQPSV